jgi:hypothetical protein
MLQDFQDFDDPGLKAALGRALPMESAPPELRRRLTELVVQAAAESAARAEHAGHNGQAARSQSTLDQSIHPADSPAALATTPPTPTQSISWRRRFIFRLGPALATAAVLAIACGGITYSVLAQKAIGDDTFRAMVKTHDHCCKARNHGSKSGNDSIAQLGRRVSSQAKEAVLAADLTADGWNFVGVALCRLDGFSAPHWVFAKGEERLSVFSLPASRCRVAREGRWRCTDIDNHPVAGFVKKGGVHCMIGSPEGLVTQDELEHLLDKHRNEIVLGLPTSAPLELMHSNAFSP